MKVIKANEDTILDKSKLSRMCESCADYLSEILDAFGKSSDVQNYLDENDMNYLAESLEILYDTAMMLDQDSKE